MLGVAAHEVGDLEGEHAVEGVDFDLVVGPVKHRRERDDVGVFELAEGGFDVGLGPVGGDDVGGCPVVTVGEQDALAEDLVLELSAGRRVGPPRQPPGGGGVAGEGGIDDPVQPARGEDLVDLFSDAGGVFSSVAAGQTLLQLVKLSVGFGQGLAKTAGLGDVEGRRDRGRQKRCPPQQLEARMAL